jgi:hypothetical protein
MELLMSNSRALIACLLAATGLTACGPRTIHSMFLPQRYVVESTMEYVEGGRVLSQTQLTRCVVRDVSDSMNNDPTIYDVEGEPHWIKSAGGGILVLEVLGHYPCLWEAAPAVGTEANPPEQALKMALYGSWLIDDVNRPQRIEVLNTAELFVRNEGYPQLRSFTARVVERGRPTRALEDVFPGVHTLGDGTGTTTITAAGLATNEFVGVQATLRTDGEEVGYLRVEPNPSLLRFVADPEPQRLVKTILYRSDALPVDENGRRPWFPQLCLGSGCTDRPDASAGNTRSSASLLVPGGLAEVEMTASSITRSPDTFGIRSTRR